MNRSSKKSGQSVNVATLKAELSKYLRLVQSGEQVVVLDHKMPVARIIPFERDETVAFALIQARSGFSDFFKINAPESKKKPVMDSLSILLKDRSSRS